MGASTGMTGGQMGLGLLKGGMTGLSQGLANYQNPYQGFNFSQLQQGIQNARRPALGQKATPNAAASPFSQNPFWNGDPNVNGGYYT